MKFLLMLTGGLQISDGLMTDYFVKLGVVNEGNHLISGLVYDRHFILFKAAGAILCTLALFILSKRFPRLAVTTAAGTSCLSALVVFWNLNLLVRL